MVGLWWFAMLKVEAVRSPQVPMNPPLGVASL
jgi:hypothetical protein